MPDFEIKVDSLLKRIAGLLTERDWRMATAESCTGGWVAKCCTDMAGSSTWFDRGYVAYSYRAKEQMLGVSHDELLKYGAVSDEIACQMATGAKAHSNAAVTVSATGIAGPGGGMPGKPVALFWKWAVSISAITISLCTECAVRNGMIKSDALIWRSISAAHLAPTPIVVSMKTSCS